MLEIGQDGFRLLRPDDLDPCLACPWGLVHSWSTNGPTFSFRVFEERAKDLVSYTMALEEADNLFREIQNTIKGILDEKKEFAIAVPDFEILHKQILAEQSGDRLGLLKQSLVKHFFTSLQGQRIVQAMDNSFDKVEAALLLHAKLIDVSHFQTVLDALECQEDRENVWHRINIMRKKNYNPLKLVSSPSEQIDWK
ncbi:hypothetical protein BSKO_01591 [Bryopsis sp. KO-2023]|nr:hypothetical protein BSKO_01591 [Bryopsis sp. KO-2023]